MKARDQDYTEAEAVYRKLHVEIVKMYRAGGYTELPPEMSALLAGTAHQDYLKLTTEVKQSNSRSVAGEFKIPWIRRLVGASKEGSELALLVCTDATGTTTRTPGQPDNAGGAAIEVFYFKRVNDALKIWAVDVDRTTRGCP